MCRDAHARAVKRAGVLRLREYRDRKRLCRKCGVRPRKQYYQCQTCRVKEKARQAKRRAGLAARREEQAAALRIDQALLQAKTKRATETARLQKQRVDNGLTLSGNPSAQKPIIPQE